MNKQTFILPVTSLISAFKVNKETTITTTTKGPYRDAFSTRDEFLLYKYRGTDPNFHENRKLRESIGQR